MNLEEPPPLVKPAAEGTALERLLGELQEPAAVTDGKLATLGLLLSGAIAEDDAAALSDALRRLQWLVGEWGARGAGKDPALAERRGVLLGLLEMVRWALQRGVPSEDRLQLDDDLPHAVPFLRAVEANPRCGNGAIEDALGLKAPRVSRIGTELVELGLAHRRRRGARNEWSLSAKGRQFLARQPVAQPEPERERSAELVRRVMNAVLAGRDWDRDAVAPGVHAELMAFQARLERVYTNRVHPEIYGDERKVACLLRLDGIFDGERVRIDDSFRCTVEDGLIVGLESTWRPGSMRLADVDAAPVKRPVQSTTVKVTEMFGIRRNKPFGLTSDAIETIVQQVQVGSFHTLDVLTAPVEAKLLSNREATGEIGAGPIKILPSRPSAAGIMKTAGESGMSVFTVPAEGQS